MTDDRSGESSLEPDPLADFAPAAEGGWRVQTLGDHLRGTAALARGYADEFSAAIGDTSQASGTTSARRSQPGRDT